MAGLLLDATRMDAIQPVPPPAAAAVRRFTCRLEPHGPRGHLLRVAGALYAGWAGRLAAELARNRITIHRVRALRSPSMIWEAQLELEALPGGADPETLDLAVLLADRRDPPRAPAPVLTAARVRPGPGAATVEIHAEDAVGFLERVLGTFAFFSLFPCELRVETRGRHVVDVFRLQGLGGRPPTATALRGLEARLAELCGTPVAP
ncbi:MAG TPA: hypothetical protein VD838_15555 [Anaeromyxobacteraceae bacterium]|nr:hypothetical protein [Anaeromyxobacteraceae bacterium]